MQHEKIIYFTIALIPVFLGLFYAIGFNYLSGYQSFYNIPYGLLGFNFNDTVYFGDLKISIFLYLLLESLCAFLFLIIFSEIFSFFVYPYFLKINSFVKLSTIVNKFKTPVELEIKIKKPMMWVMIIGVILLIMTTYILGIHTAYNQGVSFGKEQKESYDKIFLNLNNNKKIKNNVPLVIDIKNPIKNQLEKK